MRIVMIMLVAFLICACDESVGYLPDYDSGTNSDSDSDSDTDSDTDSDSDTDACDGVSCQDPPDDECQTDGTLHDYNQEADGLCIDGECVYEYTTVICEWGTCAYGDDSLAYCTSPCDEMVCTCDQFNDECTVDAGGTVELEWCDSAGCTVDTEGNPSCYFITFTDVCGLTSLGAACVDNPDGDDTCIED